MSCLPFDDVFSMGASAAECLRSMNRAIRHGSAVAVPPAMQPLTGLDDDALEALLDVAQAFYRQKKSSDMAAARRCGIVLGSPAKPLPPGFSACADQWLAGEMPESEAARRCGMPLMAFRRQARRLRAPADAPVMDARTRELCERWASGGITKSQAASEAGFSVKTFSKILRLNGFQRAARPAGAGTPTLPAQLRDAVALWEAGQISRRKAAALSGVTLKRFDACLYQIGKPIHFQGEKHDWEEAMESGAFEGAWRKWVSGSCDKRAAAAESGLSVQGFNSALRKLGLPEHIPAEKEASRPGACRAPSDDHLARAAHRWLSGREALADAAAGAGIGARALKGWVLRHQGELFTALAARIRLGCEAWAHRRLSLRDAAAFAGMPAARLKEFASLFGLKRQPAGARS